jgi:hypothetical protein
LDSPRELNVDNAFFFLCKSEKYVDFFFSFAERKRERKK